MVPQLASPSALARSLPPPQGVTRHPRSQVLEVTLSDEVIVGAVALRRFSTVLLTLLPAALGLALGEMSASVDYARMPGPPPFRPRDPCSALRPPPHAGM